MKNNQLTDRQIKELFFEIVLKEKAYIEDVDCDGENYATITGDHAKAAIDLTTSASKRITRRS